VASEPVFDREDVKALMWVLADILNELKAMRRLLEDGEEEEEGFQN
jgi:hypothetical protein